MAMSDPLLLQRQEVRPATRFAGDDVGVVNREGDGDVAVGGEGCHRLLLDGDLGVWHDANIVPLSRCGGERVSTRLHSWKQLRG